MAKRERANLLSEFREFRGQISEWKDATNKRLDDNSDTLNEIRTKVSEQKPFCSAHASVTQLIESAGLKGESQAKDITELKVRGAVIEYRLGTKDILKISGTAGIVGTIIITVLDFIVKRFIP
jgi:hypothetical protein